MSDPRDPDAKLAAKLSSKIAAEREQANRDLEALGPEAVDRLMAVVRKEAATYRCTRRFNIGIAVFVCVGLPAIMMIANALKGGNWHDFGNWTSFFSFAGIVGSVAVTSAHKNALAKLAEFKDIRAVGPLTDSLNIGDKNTRKVVEQALIELLPQLRASDAELLNDVQRGVLNNSLKSGNAEFVLAILKAFQQVGDSKAIPFVEKLEAGEGKTAGNARVKAEIPLTLELLRQKQMQEEASRTLLRASSGLAIPSDLLLRPAAGTSPSDPLELLRASVGSSGVQSDAENNLIIEILNDVKQTGDARALPYVRQLADAPSAYPVVRDAARDCMQVLSAGNP